MAICQISVLTVVLFIASAAVAANSDVDSKRCEFVGTLASGWEQQDVKALEREYKKNTGDKTARRGKRIGVLKTYFERDEYKILLARKGSEYTIFGLALPRVAGDRLGYDDLESYKATYGDGALDSFITEVKGTQVSGVAVLRAEQERYFPVEKIGDSSLGVVAMRVPEGLLVRVPTADCRNFILFTALVSEGGLARWRNEAFISKQEWDESEKLIAETLAVLQNQSIPHLAQSPDDSLLPDLGTKPLDGLPVVFNSPEQDFEAASKALGLLFQGTGDGTFAVGAITTKGLAIMAEMGDGVLWSPLNTTVLVPSDPKEFVKNVVDLTVSPSRQVKFLASHGEDLASLVSDPNLVTEALTGASNLSGFLTGSALGGDLQKYKDKISKEMERTKRKLKKEYDRQADRVKKEMKRWEDDLEDWWKKL